MRLTTEPQVQSAGTEVRSHKSETLRGPHEEEAGQQVQTAADLAARVELKDSAVRLAEQEAI